jgi:hypothetical protein
MDSSGTEQDLVGVSCEHSNEPLDYIMIQEGLFSMQLVK